MQPEDSYSKLQAQGNNGRCRSTPAFHLQLLQAAFEPRALHHKSHFRELQLDQADQLGAVLEACGRQDASRDRSELH